MIGGRVITLKLEDVDPVIDIENITSIDYSNLYGEAVTVSALLNRWGIIKAEAEKIHKTSILERRKFRAKLRKRYRKEAYGNKGKIFIDADGDEIKLTVDSLEDAILLNPKYEEMQLKEIDAKRDLDFIESIYWAVQSKDKKLNNIVRPVTPKEFISELVDKKVNGFLIDTANIKYH